MKPAEEKVFAEMREEDLVLLLRGLVRTKCEPDVGILERDLAEHCARLLREHGIEVALVEYETGRPSVVARMRGSGGGQRILFNGHLHAAGTHLEDWTVDPYEGIVRDGRIYGVGVADMKGAIAAKIAAMSAIRKARVRHRGDIILILGSGGEKAGVIGTKYLVEQYGVKAEAGVVGEPTSLEVAVAERGAIWFELATKGVAGLSGVKGVNAIEKMCDIIQTLREYGLELRKRVDPLLGSATISVNMIEAGSAPYTVPSVCKAVADRRLILSETVAQGLKETEKILSNLRKTDPQLVVEAKPLFTIEPISIPKEEPIVKVALDSLRQTTGRNHQISGFRGWTEAYHMIKAGIPTVICGPGTTSVVHAPDEYLAVQELVDSARAYALMALRFAGVD